MKTIKMRLARWKISKKGYYNKRIKMLEEHKRGLDMRFSIFEGGGIVGERLWDLEGGCYLDYINRVKPILLKRIAFYKKKI